MDKIHYVNLNLKARKNLEVKDKIDVWQIQLKHISNQPLIS